MIKYSINEEVNSHVRFFRRRHNGPFLSPPLESGDCNGLVWFLCLMAYQPLLII